MDIREQMLAVARGERPSRVPFVQYENNGGPDAEIWNVIGTESMGILRWTHMHTFDHTDCSIRSSTDMRDGQRIHVSIIETPAGSLLQERVDVPGLPGVTSIEKHFVESSDDLVVLKSYLSDIRVTAQAESFDIAERELGSHGFPHISVGRTPFQQLWIEWTGITELSYLLLDSNDLVLECAEIMGRLLIDVVSVVADAARTRSIPYAVIGDNISAPIIGRDRFSEFCAPYYREVSSILDAVGIPLFVHMDGDLMSLSDLIATSGVKGLDSMSPPPDNDTSVEEAHRLWPEMSLLVNFPSSVHVADEQVIYDTACEILTGGGDSCPLQIQVSENPPPGAWKKSYPQIVKAIQDFT